MTKWLHNEELHILFPSPIIIMVIKSIMVIWTEHTYDDNNAYNW
jgi:hypothetical protein